MAIPRVCADDRLISQAEANEMGHLEFAEMLVDHELAMREKKRVMFLWIRHSLQR